jgi:hypothetical protein
MGWNIRSDESRFLLNPVDVLVHVWRLRNTAFQQEHIVGTTAFVVEVVLLLEDVFL